MADDQIGIWYHSNPQAASTQKRKVWDEMVRRREAGELDKYGAKGSSLTAVQSTEVQAQILQDLYGDTPMAAHMSPVTQNGSLMNTRRSWDDSSSRVEKPAAQQAAFEADPASTDTATTKVVEKGANVPERRDYSALAGGGGESTTSDNANAAGVANNGQAATTTTSALAGDGVTSVDSNRVTGISDQLDFGSDFISDQSTVASQLQTLLASDSPYLEEARRGAMETAAARGLQNTSIAAGAGERAAIQSALPIVQQDASTYGTSDLATQNVTQALQTQMGQAMIEGILNEQDFTFQGTQNAINRAHEIAIQTNNFAQQDRILQMEQEHQSIENKFDRVLQSDLLASQQDHATKIEKLQFEYNNYLQNMQIASQEAMQNAELDYNESRDFQTSTTQIMHDYQVEVASLLSDMTFLESSGEDMAAVMQSLESVAKNGIMFAGSMAGLSEEVMDDYMSNAFSEDAWTT